MRPLAERLRRCPRPLALLLAIATVHGLAWAVVVAPLTGPDEPDHVAYVQHLAETGDGPQTEVGDRRFSSELDGALGLLGLAPLLGNPRARPTYHLTAEVSGALDALPDSARSDGNGPNPVAKNPPLYYAYAAAAYRLSPDRSLLDRLFLIRALTVLFFVGTVALVWLLAAELFAAGWARTLSAALVALHPKAASIGATINPEALLVLLSTAQALIGVRLVRRGLAPGLVAAAALVAGAAVLTHGRGFAVVPVAVLAVLIAAVRHRHSLAVRAAGARLLLFGGLLLVPIVGAFLYTRSHTLVGAFGGEVSQAAASGFQIAEMAVNVWQFYLPKLGFMGDRLGPDYGYRQMYIETFFGSLASLEINHRPAVYDALQVAAGLGLLALLGVVVRRWERVRARWPEVIVLATVFLALIFLLHLAAYRDLARGAPDPLITGRYLLPAVSVYAAAATFVVVSLPPRVGAVLGGVLLGLNVLFGVGALGIALERFYA